ncbi:MAG: sensor histidine kinase [Verrucomicrobia bacterium]|nr:sensor histidine kinase [Verrucomicrobiota bacterium]
MVDTKLPIRNWAVIAAGVLTVAVFLVDRRKSPGLAVSLFYLAPILLTMWAPRRWHTLFIANAATLLIVLGYRSLPVPEERGFEFGNRMISLVAVWVVATIAMVRRQEEDKFQEMHEKLENQIRDHSNELARANAELKAEITDRENAEAALRQLSTHLLTAQDDERRRIARELHDTTAQSLAAVSMNLSRIETLAPDLAPKAADLLADSVALTSACQQEIRTLSYLLHPPMLEEAGLGPAVQWFANGVQQRANIQVTVDVPEKLDRLPNDIETTLFRIVQESMNNITRHSGSPSARIKLVRNTGEVVLEVKDEGQGIPPEKLERVNGNISGLGVGIAGIWERVRQFGGDLDITSNSRGTTVTVVLPLEGEVK